MLSGENVVSGQKGTHQTHLMLSENLSGKCVKGDLSVGSRFGCFGKLFWNSFVNKINENIHKKHTL